MFRFDERVFYDVLVAGLFLFGAAFLWTTPWAWGYQDGGVHRCDRRRTSFSDFFLSFLSFELHFASGAPSTKQWVDWENKIKGGGWKLSPMTHWFFAVLPWTLCLRFSIDFSQWQIFLGFCIERGENRLVQQCSRGKFSSDTWLIA